jgi:hypothetical protein
MKKQSLIIGSSLLGICAGAGLASAEVNQPQEITMRPLTTPGGQITVAGDMFILLIPDLDTGIGLGVGGSYGVDDKIEVGAAYGIALAPEFDAKGGLGVEAAYRIMDGNISLAADVATGYDLAAEGISPLELGARFRFRLDDKLAINSGGGQLNITLDGDPKPITLDLPVGVSYQVSPQLYGFLNTSLANISIADSTTVVFGADYIPLQVGAFFSPSNTLDVGGAVSWFDLKEASDTLGITLAGRLHM